MTGIGFPGGKVILLFLTATLLTSYPTELPTLVYGRFNFGGKFAGVSVDQ